MKGMQRMKRAQNHSSVELIKERRIFLSRFTLFRQSVHSEHDSVLPDPEPLLADVDNPIHHKSVKRLQAFVRSLMHQRHLQNVLKKAYIKEDTILISRHFKKLIFRKSSNYTDTMVHYIITFRVEKKHKPKPEPAKNVLYIGDDAEKLDPSEMSNPLEPLPILFVKLECRNNFLLDCTDKLDLERYLVLGKGESLKEKLTFGNLNVICQKLLDNMFVVDSKVHYHESLINIINWPFELESPIHKKPELYDLLAERINKGYNPPMAIRYVKDGCVYEYGRDNKYAFKAMKQKSALKQKHDPKKTAENGEQEDENRYVHDSRIIYSDRDLYLITGVQLRYRLKHYMRNLRKKNPDFYQIRLTDEQIVTEVKRIQKNVRRWLESRARDQNDPIKDRRRIIFSGLARIENPEERGENGDPEEDYINIIVLINKKGKGEVHAYDFNKRQKLKPLLLEPKMLYTDDLDIESIFRKIELNMRDMKVQITDFNKFQINQNKIMQQIYNMSDQNKQRLIRAQAQIKRYIRNKLYIRNKNAKSSIEHKSKNNIIARFFKIYNGQRFIVNIIKDKFETEIKIQARTQGGERILNAKTDKTETIPLELVSNVFREKKDKKDKEEKRNHALEEYVRTLKERLQFDESNPNGLTMKIEFGKPEEELNVKSKQMLEEVESKKKKDDQVESYFQLRFAKFSRDIFKLQTKVYVDRITREAEDMVEKKEREPVQAGKDKAVISADDNINIEHTKLKKLERKMYNDYINRPTDNVPNYDLIYTKNTYKDQKADDDKHEMREDRDGLDDLKKKNKEEPAYVKPIKPLKDPLDRADHLLHLREQDKDIELFRDEIMFAKKVTRLYQKYRFIVDGKVSEGINDAINKEKRSKIVTQDKQEEGRPSLSETSTYMELDSGPVSIQGSTVDMDFYYDLRFNDIVYKYKGPNDQDYYDNASFEELEIETRDIDELKSSIREIAGRNLVVNPLQRATAQKDQSQKDVLQKDTYISRNKLFNLPDGLAAYDRMMNDLKNREDNKMRRDANLYKVDIGDEDSFEEAEQQKIAQKQINIAKLMSRLRSFPLVKKIRDNLRIQRKAAQETKKFIVRSFYIEDTESYTISFCFCQNSYTFEIYAYSWEDPLKVLEARLVLDTFFKMFKFTKTPHFGVTIFPATLKDIFGSYLFKILDKIEIEHSRVISIDEPEKEESMTNKKERRAGGRLKLNWEEEDSSTKDSEKENEPPSELTEVERAKRRVRSIKRAYLEPMVSDMNKQYKEQFERTNKRNAPVFNAKLKPEERMKLAMSCYITIQKIWRGILGRRMVAEIQRKNNLPHMKNYTCFQTVEGVTTKIVILYDRLQKSFFVYPTFFTKEGPLWYWTKINIQPILDCALGREFSQNIDTKSPHFKNMILPTLGRVIAERLQFIAPTELNKNYQAKIHLDTSVESLDLKVRQKSSLLQTTTEKKDQVIQTAPDYVLKRLIKIQRRFRIYICFKRVRELLALRRKKNEKIKKYGQLILMTFKKIGDDIYKIWVFERGGKEEDNQLTFLIVPSKKSVTEQKSFLEHKIADYKLLNTHGLPLLKYLLQVLEKTPPTDPRRFFFNIPTQPKFVKVLDRRRAHIEMDALEKMDEQAHKGEQGEGKEDGDTLDRVS
jgi:hypothetical protein